MALPGFTGINDGAITWAGDPGPVQLALQHVARGPGLIAALPSALGLALQLADQAVNRSGFVDDFPLEWRALARTKQGHDDAVLVDIEADESASLHYS